VAKKEKKPQEQIITLFNKDYKESELSEEQKVMINHVADLERKIQSSEFNLQQLRFGKQAFLDALKVSIEKDEQKDQETK
jgi:microcompartment protein CcmL/EutN